jgi:hypothetical protein
MTGSCWRLLAAVSLIFVAVAPAFLRAQDAAADRSPGIAPDLASDLVAPVLAPDLAPLRYDSPIAPVWIPPPSLPRPYPVGRDPVVRYPVGGYSAIPRSSVFQQLVFRRMVRAAGIIFSGRVTFIGRAASSFGQATASTTVTFQVEHAIRGASTGRNLTIREWAGLWSSGERYRVGERVLLFLYSPGRLGLTSPVAGGLGKFAMDSRGRIVMSQQHVATLAADPILGGKTVVPYADFALAVQRSSQEE